MLLLVMLMQVYLRRRCRTVLLLVHLLVNNLCLGLLVMLHQRRCGRVGRSSGVLDHGMVVYVVVVVVRHVLRVVPGGGGHVHLGRGDHGRMGVVRLVDRLMEGARGLGGTGFGYR